MPSLLCGAAELSVFEAQLAGLCRRQKITMCDDPISARWPAAIRQMLDQSKTFVKVCATCWTDRARKVALDLLPGAMLSPLVACKSTLGGKSRATMAFECACSPA